MIAPTISAADRQEIVPHSQAEKTVKRILAQNEKAFRAALGAAVPFERFARIVLTVCERTPKLYDCDRASLLLSCFRIAQLGLSPDASLGQAWLIPRKGKAEFQLGYKGLIQLAYRSPLVAAVRYGVVRTDDEFEFVDGKNYRLRHKPSGMGWPENQAETVAAWCVIDLRSGASVPRVMYLPEIMRHKQRGEGSQPAWSTDFAAMAVKTVIGDACRRAPVDSETGRALALDAAGDAGKGQANDGTDPVVIDVESVDVPPSSKLDAFGEAFGQAPAQPVEAPDALEAFGPAEPEQATIDRIAAAYDAPKGR